MGQMADPLGRTEIFQNIRLANGRCSRRTDIRQDIGVCQVAVREIERNGKNPSTSDRNRNRVVLPRLGCAQSVVLKRRMGVNNIDNAT
jgi:hypothetical protein